RSHVHHDRRRPVPVLDGAVLCAAPTRAAAAHRAIDPVLAAARVRRWLGGHDRHGGDLQRHTRLQPPESRNAAHTIVTMAVILALMFLGLSFLIVGGQIIPREEQTVISLLGHAVFGDGPFYYVVQISAVLILVLAANTAYPDLPRLAS